MVGKTILRDPVQHKLDCEKPQYALWNDDEPLGGAF